MTRSSRLGLIFGSVAIGTLLNSGVAAAQQAPTAPSGASAIQEVVVTANKRRERLLDVGMSVSAISGEALARNQTLDLEDLAAQVPGFSLARGGSSNAGGTGSRLILRGLNASGYGPTAATIVDDIPFSLSGSNSFGGYFATDLDSYDMNQIEVLRGPQGSLYGASAEGGLIKYVTNAPDPKGYHAGIELGALSLEHGGAGGSAKGFVNVPLLDGTAAVRATIFDEELPGWIGDSLRGKSRDNEGHRYGGRLSLLWTPTNDLTIRTTAIYQTARAGGTDRVLVNGSGNANPFGLSNGYNYDTYLAEPNSQISSIYSVNVEYNLHWARLQSITSYGTGKNTYNADAFFLDNVFAPKTEVPEKGIFPLHKFSQELRLTSEPGNTIFSHPFEWQLGAFDTRERSNFLFDYVELGVPSGNVIGGPLIYAGGRSSYSEVAGYADGTYHFTPQFDVELGGRIFSNKVRSQSVQGGTLLGFGITPLKQYSSSESSGTYSIAPRFHLNPDMLIYARVASGYRPGGPDNPIPNGPPGAPTSFTSDSLVSYETGFKGSLFEKRLTVDVAAYYIDWSKVQVQILVPFNGLNYGETENAGAAVSQGLEWSLNWNPTRGLNLGLVGAYDDAHLTADIPNSGGGRKGDRLPYVPKLSTNLNFNYERDLSEGYRGFVGGAWNFVGDRYSDFTSNLAATHQKVPSYDTLELQAGVRRGGYTIELYGKNLTDERGITSYSPSGAGPGASHGVASLIRPLTVGFRLAATY